MATPGPRRGFDGHPWPTKGFRWPPLAHEGVSMATPGPRRGFDGHPWPTKGFDGHPWPTKGFRWPPLAHEGVSMATPGPRRGFDGHPVALPLRGPDPIRFLNENLIGSGPLKSNALEVHLGGRGSLQDPN